MKITNLCTFLSLASILFFGSCKKNNLNFLNQEIVKAGHIPYLIPLEFAGPGTLIGGAPKSLQVVAAPDTCFPDTVNGMPTNLRKYDHSSLPKRSYHFSISSDMNFRLFDFLQSGNGVIRVGSKFGVVKGIELDMQGVHLEYFDSIKLTEFYRDSISEICKDYLDKVGFIIQAIRVDRLVFEFLDSANQTITFEAQNLDSIVDIDAKITWRIEDKTKLVIETPKYIAYQIGSLRRKEEGMVLYRAVTVKNGKYTFKPLALFQDEAVETGEEETPGNGNGDDTSTLPRQPEPDSDKFHHVEMKDHTSHYSRYIKLPKELREKKVKEKTLIIKK